MTTATVLRKSQEVIRLERDHAALQQMYDQLFEHSQNLAESAKTTFEKLKEELKQRDWELEQVREQLRLSRIQHEEAHRQLAQAQAACGIA